jgi:nitrogen fixation NifU-like protein
MFSPEVLDHFKDPRNAGSLENATASVEVTNPVCGDVLRLAALVESGKIVEVKFLCRGCTTAIACASRLTELLTGSSLAAPAEISVETIATALGGLPSETIHGAHLAADAARALFAQLRR